MPGGETAGKAYVRILADGDGLPGSIRREMSKGKGEFRRAGYDAGGQYSAGFGESTSERFKRLGDDITSKFGTRLSNMFRKLNLSSGLEREQRSSHQVLGKMIADIDLLGDGVGRTFGRGSRSEFLNFFGGLIGGSLRLLGVLPRVVSGVMGLGKSIGAVTSGLQSGMTLGQALASSGISMSRLAAGAVAAGVAAAALLVIIPILISMLTLLGGIVIALAGSITFALVGGIAALSALILPLAAGIGVLTGAIASLDDHSKKVLKDSIRPLVTEMKALGKIAADELFKDAPRQARELGEALTGLDSLVRRSAAAMSDTADVFINGLNSKNFDSFIAVMETFIPRALRSLGQSAASTLGGIGGLFRAIASPGGIAEDMLDFIERITDKFNDWANSTAGQSSIIAFFERAGDSAASLGELLDNVAELLGELLTSGQGTGDTIIDHLAQKTQELTDFLNRNPQAVENFFGDVGDFADSVGRALRAVMQFIDAVDTPASRKAATIIFTTMSASITQFTDIVGWAIGWITGGWNKVAVVFGDVAGAIVSAMGHVAGAIADAIDVIPDKFLPDWAEDARDSLRGFSEDSKVAAARLRDIGEVKPKVKVDDTQLKALKATANTTDASLRILLGLPPIKPKVDRKDLVGGKTATEEMLGRMKQARDSDPVVLRAKRMEVDLAKLSSLKLKGAFEEMSGRVSRGTRLKIDALQVRIARDAVRSFLSAWNAINPFKRVTIETVNRQVYRGATKTATGGVLLNGMRMEQRRLAYGGMLNSQTQLSAGVTAGEAGRELVVPVDRPLGQVDPSVRYLAAIAQGLVPASSTRTVNNNLTVVTPTENPYAVAKEVVNEFAANGYNE